MFKKSKLFLMLALAIVLCFASITTAFAAQPQGTEANPAQAAITKLLKVPHGTAIPSTTFQFKVTPISVDGSNPLQRVSALPTPATHSASFLSAFPLSELLRLTPLKKPLATLIITTWSQPSFSAMSAF